jgi:hypothetical protein
VILDEVYSTLKERLVLKSDDHFVALTLWIAFCHAVKEFDFAPRLAIWSPEKRCGKSLLLEVITYLVPKSRLTTSVSSSALFRSIAKDESSVFLIDEADTVFGKKVGSERAEELRMIVNSGFKRGATVMRSNPTTFEPMDFKVFCPIALAGIGKDSIPETILDRGVKIEMRRKLHSEKILEFQLDEAEEIFGSLAERLATELGSASMRDLRPYLPEELNSRAKDCWKPLFKIATYFGDDWVERCRVASIALELEADDPEDSSLSKRLLSDCKTVFVGDRMPTADLVHALCALEEAPWRSQDLNANRLAFHLKAYGLKSVVFYSEDKKQIRGFKRVQFEEAWSRYLQETVRPVRPVTQAQDNLYGQEEPKF